MPSSQETTRILTMLTTVHHIVGAQEIAHMFGVSRQRVQQLISRDDFPAPIRTLAMGKVWHTEDVIRWATAKGRQVKE